MILGKTENQSFWAPNFELLIIKNECGFSAPHAPHALFLSMRCPLCPRSRPQHQKQTYMAHQDLRFGSQEIRDGNPI
jgi:hypothetical protein